MPNDNGNQPNRKDFEVTVDKRFLGVEYYRAEFDRLYPVLDMSDKELWKLVFAIDPTIDDPDIMRRVKKHKASLALSRALVEAMLKVIGADPSKARMLKMMQRQKLTAS